MKKILAVSLLVLSFGLAAKAQFLPEPSTAKNVYAGGLSASVGSKDVAGTGLYARAVSDSTYAFTVIDVVPSTLKPVVVTSNVGVGIAQKVTIGGKSIFLPTAAGISWNGPNTGWEWNGGALIPVYRAKGIDYLLTARFLKSSVSGGEGYQPIVGFLASWGN